MQNNNVQCYLSDLCSALTECLELDNQAQQVLFLKGIEGTTYLMYRILHHCPGGSMTYMMTKAWMVYTGVVHTYMMQQIARTTMRTTFMELDALRTRQVKSPLLEKPRTEEHPMLTGSDVQSTSSGENLQREESPRFLPRENSSRYQPKEDQCWELRNMDDWLNSVVSWWFAGGVLAIRGGLSPFLSSIKLCDLIEVVCFKTL